MSWNTSGGGMFLRTRHVGTAAIAVLLCALLASSLQSVEIPLKVTFELRTRVVPPAEVFGVLVGCAIGLAAVPGVRPWERFGALRVRVCAGGVAVVLLVMPQIVVLLGTELYSELGVHRGWLFANVLFATALGLSLGAVLGPVLGVGAATAGYAGLVLVQHLLSRTEVWFPLSAGYESHPRWWPAVLLGAVAVCVQAWFGGLSAFGAGRIRNRS